MQLSLVSQGESLVPQGESWSLKGNHGPSNGPPLERDHISNTMLNPNDLKIKRNWTRVNDVKSKYLLITLAEKPLPNTEPIFPYTVCNLCIDSAININADVSSSKYNSLHKLSISKLNISDSIGIKSKLKS